MTIIEIKALSFEFNHSKYLKLKKGLNFFKELNNSIL